MSIFKQTISFPTKKFQQSTRIFAKQEEGKILLRKNAEIDEPPYLALLPLLSKFLAKHWEVMIERPNKRFFFVI